MEQISFNYQESLLALTAVVSNADGVNHSSEVDVRVNMILNEKISNSTIKGYEAKYAELDGGEKTLEVAIESLQSEDDEAKAKALAYMYLVANVGTTDEDELVDLSQLEEVENWQNSDDYVDLEELAVINKAKKELKISLSAIKDAFKNLPEARRITG